MKIRILKSEAHYDEAVARLEQLLELDTPTQDELDDLELLGALIERYEEEHFPIDLSTPAAAIRFRMEQQGLKPSDLIPYLGSKSRVSEVLSGKRPLSLQMIRSLVTGLGIPAEVLLQTPGAALPPDSGIEWSRFPIAEMLKRGWFENFGGTLAEAKQCAEELMSDFARSVKPDLLKPVLYRRRAANDGDSDGYALAAWRIRMCNRALAEEVSEYRPDSITPAFVQEIVRLSYLEEGPKLAREFLMKNGIHLLVERHFKKTRLDGATMLGIDGHPIIGLTLRHDRLDNFWFTLCHELAHIALHLKDADTDVPFFDDLERPSDDAVEQAADRWASEQLLDEEAWRESGLKATSPYREVLSWARQMRINPAIPAGRIRKENKDYKLFSKLVGQGKVRCLFPGGGW